MKAITTNTRIQLTCGCPNVLVVPRPVPKPPKPVAAGLVPNEVPNVEPVPKVAPVPKVLPPSVLEPNVGAALPNAGAKLPNVGAALPNVGAPVPNPVPAPKVPVPKPVPPNPEKDFF